MDGLNYHDMQKMRAQAEQRIRQMQKKADRAISASDMPPVPNFVRTNAKAQNSHNNTLTNQKTEQDKTIEKAKHFNKPQQNKGLNLLKMFNFGNIKLDKDVMLIIVMILLLSSEDSDELLLLALAYIML